MCCSSHICCDCLPALLLPPTPGLHPSPIKRPEALDNVSSRGAGSLRPGAVRQEPALGEAPRTWFRGGDLCSAGLTALLYFIGSKTHTCFTSIRMSLFIGGTLESTKYGKNNNKKKKKKKKK